MPSGAVAIALVDSISTIFCGMACQTFDSDCNETWLYFFICASRASSPSTLAPLSNASTAP